MTPIKYVGIRPTYRDGTYGTGTQFVQGETRPVSDDVAVKMLRHIDVYELGSADDIDAGAPIPAALNKRDDNQDDDATQAMRDSVANMDKAALTVFAKTHFSQTLNARMGVEKARIQVIGLIDQFGVA